MLQSNPSLHLHVIPNYSVYPIYIKVNKRHSIGLYTQDKLSVVLQTSNVIQTSFFWIYVTLTNISKVLYLNIQYVRRFTSLQKVFFLHSKSKSNRERTSNFTLQPITTIYEYETNITAHTTRMARVQTKLINKTYILTF